MGSLGINQPNIRSHWICKKCEIVNHNSRLKCLSCNQKRENVEAKDKEFNKLMKKMDVAEDYTVGMTLDEIDISRDWVKTNFNNGEYP